MYITLPPRLSAVASLVPYGSVAADIGTDHGFVPIYLLQNGICLRAVAADINPAPLGRAAGNIKGHDLPDKIKCVLSDGFSALSPDDADTFIIAGMGGEGVASMLERCKWAENGRYTYIMQPMTKKEALRRYLFDNGYDIQTELLACEKDRIYTVFSAVYTGVTTEYTEIDLILGKKRQAGSPYRQAFLRQELKNLYRWYNGMASSGKTPDGELVGLIKDMEKMLNDEC